MPRYPHSGGSADRRLAVFASLLLHVSVGLVVALWLPRRPPPPIETEQPVQMVFELPVEAPAAELPQVPQVEAAPAPVQPPSPQPVQANEPPPDVPPAPAAPPVQQALALPPPPAPPPTPPTEPPEETPQKAQPAPSPPPPRPQPRPVMRTRPPAAPQPAPSAGPTQPASPAPVPAPPPSTTTDPGWRTQLSAWLAAHKSYPEAARRRGEQGNVMLRFVVERSGRVAEVAVMRGSGSSVLDAAAEGLLRNATLPAFPATMPQERIVVTVQLHFALQD